METYIYCADIYCEDCAKSIMSNETKDLAKENTGDSNDYPQGPYPASEADCPQHCADCGIFLENPLTDDGVEYVKECNKINPKSDVVIEWLDYYDYIEVPEPATD